MQTRKLEARTERGMRILIVPDREEEEFGRAGEGSYWIPNFESSFDASRSCWKFLVDDDEDGRR